MFLRSFHGKEINEPSKSVSYSESLRSRKWLQLIVVCRRQIAFNGITKRYSFSTILNDRNLYKDKPSESTSILPCLMGRRVWEQNTQLIERITSKLGNGEKILIILQCLACWDSSDTRIEMEKWIFFLCVHLCARAPRRLPKVTGGYWAPLNLYGVTSITSISSAHFVIPGTLPPHHFIPELICALSEHLDFFVGHFWKTGSVRPWRNSNTGNCGFLGRKKISPNQYERPATLKFRLK